MYVVGLRASIEAGVWEPIDTAVKTGAAEIWLRAPKRATACESEDNRELIVRSSCAITLTSGLFHIGSKHDPVPEDSPKSAQGKHRGGWLFWIKGHSPEWTVSDAATCAWVSFEFLQRRAYGGPPGCRIAGVLPERHWPRLQKTHWHFVVVWSGPGGGTPTLYGRRDARSTVAAALRAAG